LFKVEQDKTSVFGGFYFPRRYQVGNDFIEKNKKPNWYKEFESVAKML